MVWKSGVVRWAEAPSPVRRRRLTLAPRERTATADATFLAGWWSSSSRVTRDPSTITSRKSKRSRDFTYSTYHLPPTTWNLKRHLRALNMGIVEKVSLTYTR